MYSNLILQINSVVLASRWAGGTLKSIENIDRTFLSVLKIIDQFSEMSVILTLV